MTIVRRSALAFLLVALVCGLTACQKSNPTPEEAIPTPIPATSKFAKIQLGWSLKRVQDTIGEPTEMRDYATGKAFIPFYFGSDSYRMEGLYKGEGRIIYAGGAGISAQGFTVHKIIYDANESGYNDKKMNPDGPQNVAPVEAETPPPPAKPAKKKAAPKPAVKKDPAA